VKDEYGWQHTAGDSRICITVYGRSSSIDDIKLQEYSVIWMTALYRQEHEQSPYFSSSPVTKKIIGSPLLILSVCMVWMGPENPGWLSIIPGWPSISCPPSYSLVEALWEEF
jgi:hypothetical protein